MIGRSPTADVACSSPYVSKVHAFLHADDSCWQLIDNQSKNGTIVDNRSVGQLNVTRMMTVWLGGVGRGEQLVVTPGPLAASDVGFDASLPRTASDIHVRCGSGSYTFRAGEQPVIGRDHDCDVQVSSPLASRRHVRLAHDSDGWTVHDLGSKRGTHGPDGLVVRLSIDRETTIWLGPAGAGERVVLSTATVTPARRVIRIGRELDNDLVLTDLLVSRYHAELVQDDDGTWSLQDVGSHNGSFVDSCSSQRVRLANGQRVTLGQSTFRFHDGQLQPVEADTWALEARGLSVMLDDGQSILDDVSFELSRGSLLSIVGPTGSGKSTLLKALTGMRPPDLGDVFVNGCNFYDAFDELRRTLGYVPQEDILHPQLTVRRALDFGAQLRFPPDVSEQERRTRISEVLAELGLDHRQHVAIEKLSGGQRKRTSVALELLTKPSLLFLDEPTSGLDPGFEKSVMGLLRELADSGRAVVLVTHSLQSLGLCDKALFLARGGVTAFCGPPEEALPFFGRGDFADVFQDLEDHGERFRPLVRRQGPPGEGGSKAGPTPGTHLVAASSTTVLPAPSARWRTQLWTLVRRQLAIVASDRRNLLFLAIEVVVPAVLILLLTGPGALGPAGSAGSARTLIGAVVVAATAIGTANSMREIVKESAIYLRERSIGLSRSAYLVSKIVVVGCISAVQAALLVTIAVQRADGPKVSLLLQPPVLELAVVVALGALAASALGLLVSALVSTSEKALALVPVIFIVQWLLSGMTIDLEQRPGLKHASYVASANWALAGAAASGDLLSLEAPLVVGSESPAPPAPDRARDARWEHRTSNWVLSAAALGLLSGASVGAASLALARKEPALSHRRVTFARS